MGMLWCHLAPLPQNLAGLWVTRRQKEVSEGPLSSSCQSPHNLRWASWARRPLRPAALPAIFPAPAPLGHPLYLHFEAKKTPRGEISRPFSLSIMREPRLQAL